MKLLTKTQFEKLVKNGVAQDPVRGTKQEIDFEPVVRLFTPDANATWLLSEIDSDNHDIAFGLCDLGMGFPELGSVYLPELIEFRGVLGLPIERDLYFTARKTLLEYAREAWDAGHITS